MRSGLCRLCSWCSASLADPKHAGYTGSEGLAGTLPKVPRRSGCIACDMMFLARVVCLPLPCRYGLLGLLHVIRMTEPDLTMLALGTDLTGLGLNLNSPDPLYKVRVLACCWCI